MASRRENIKKSLGITEYPWSSDEDDTQNADMNSARQRSAEPRISVADAPGTSGHQFTPMHHFPAQPSRGTQSEVVCSTYSHNNPQPLPSDMRRMRSSDSSNIFHHGTEMGISYGPLRPAPDIYQTLAFKKLHNNMCQRSNNGFYSMSSRGLAGPSRNPIFSPISSHKFYKAVKRFRPNHPARFPERNRNSNVPTNDIGMQTGDPISRNQDCPQMRVALYPDDNRHSPEPFVVALPSEAPIGMDIEDSQSPSRPINENSGGDDHVLVEEGSLEPNNNLPGAGVSPEQETVNVDLQDETDGGVEAEGTSAVNNSEEGLNEAPTVPANDDGESSQSNNEGAQSARRDGSGSAAINNAASFTAKEFNLNLLRLLECPVCLEWMEPPMSQCRRGHLVCIRCRDRLSSCPVCRTTFSSVRNRAMEGVAEIVLYPCRHSCGREVRLRRRGAHEASCSARRYSCPAPGCAHRTLPRDHLSHHFQNKHLAILKVGQKHKFSLKMNIEQHDLWLVSALQEFFSLRVDLDVRSWGVLVYVAFIGPKCDAKKFTYEVSLIGKHNNRKLVYIRSTHSDLENSALNVSRQDCFHLNLDQALNFIRIKNKHCEADKFLELNVEINKTQVAANDSES